MGRISATERRDLLFAAAMRVLAREGLAALSTRAVVREAGMSLASFHYAYDSHADLLTHIIESVIEDERLAGLTGLTGQPSSPRAAVHGALSSYLDLVRADPGREQGMFELTQHALRTPSLRPLATRQYASYHAAMVGLLDHLADQFSLTWSTPTADVARLAVSLTDGLTLAWLTDRDDDAAARLVDLAAEALLTHLEES